MHNEQGPSRHRIASFGAALLVALSSLPSCSTGPAVTFREGAREFVASDYDAILERWTRAEQLYSLQGVDDVLSVTATFESWEFRWAYMIRYAEDYRLTIEQRRELLASALGDTRKHHQFYVALYGRNTSEGDLAQPNPGWVARLVDDRGNVTAPEEIVPIRKPSVIEKVYFPYTTPWRQAFRVRFPAEVGGVPTLAPNAKVATLRFSGPLGSLELQWRQAK